jgi:hypothetical protein
MAVTGSIFLDQLRLGYGRDSSVILRTCHSAVTFLVTLGVISRLDMVVSEYTWCQRSRCRASQHEEIKMISSCHPSSPAFAREPSWHGPSMQPHAPRTSQHHRPCLHLTRLLVPTDLSCSLVPNPTPATSRPSASSSTRQDVTVLERAGLADRGC